MKSFTYHLESYHNENIEEELIDFGTIEGNVVVVRIDIVSKLLIISIPMCIHLCSTLSINYLI